MRLINHQYLSLPGLSKITLKRYRLITDLIFFILFTGIPTSFYAFINRKIFYQPQIFLDIYVLFLLISLIYLVMYIKHLPKLFKVPGGKAFFILVLFLFFQIFYSYTFKGIPLTEIFTIFRKNFFWPLAALGFLLYVSTFDTYRLQRFFRWLVILTIIQSVVYLFANMFNLDFYGTKSAHEYLTQNSTVYMQNLYATPKYLIILFVFSLTTALTSFKYNKHWHWMLGLIVIGISVLRSTLIIYLIIIGCILFFIIIRHNQLYLRNEHKILLSGYFKNSIKVFILLFIYIGVAYAVFPTRINFLIAKFLSLIGSTNSGDISMVSFQGTFSLRLLLIGEAFIRTRGNLLLGNGYIRESIPGDYDFVIGGDTFIAPVIFCEGFMGMFLRWLPILIILIVSLKYIFTQNSKRYYLYYISIVCLILISFINIIQTGIYIHYHQIFFIFMLTQFIIYHDNKKDLSRIN